MIIAQTVTMRVAVKPAVPHPQVHRLVHRPQALLAHPQVHLLQVLVSRHLVLVARPQAHHPQVHRPVVNRQVHRPQVLVSRPQVHRPQVLVPRPQVYLLQVLVLRHLVLLARPQVHPNNIKRYNMPSSCDPIFPIIFKDNSFNDAEALIAGKPTFKDSSKKKGGPPSQSTMYLSPNPAYISDTDPNADVICLKYQAYTYYNNLRVLRDNNYEYLSSYDPQPIPIISNNTIQVPSLLTEVVSEYTPGYQGFLTLAKISIKPCGSCPSE